MIFRALNLSAAVLLLFVDTATGHQTPALAQERGWPREIRMTEGKLVLYQPQPESLSGTLLKARAAASFTKPGAPPIFGALWLTARVDTDRDTRIALIRDVAVTRIRWPNAKPEVQDRVSRAIEADFPKEGFHISLDRLTSSLATAEREQRSMDGIRNDPPKIVFVETRSVLLIYDGEPKTAKIENSSFDRVINSPWAVARDNRTGTWYLSGGKFWYSATSAMGPWIPEPKPPQDLLQMSPKDTSSVPAPAVPPAVVVTTLPTELIVTEGAPNWQQVAGGKLLYVKNTETPWLREVDANLQYVLLSGRWFRSATKDGPWTFVRPDSLPAVFKEIPPGSDIGGVRASVAGTEEAEDATLDLHVPQTAAIKRTEAKLTVEYKGEPKFKDIAGTRVAYAENTGTQVLRIDSVYYAVDNGVWFTSKAATGPWALADSIPEGEIQKIPPSEPVYNVSHVHVYESTPEVVYVGYTPGYMWSFPYYGVPIYGTGWIYPPYYLGPIYYPRPYTYGFAMGYNPYYGWGVGMAWTTGFFTFGIMFGGWGGGWYGHPPGWGYYPPGGYRPGGCYGCGGGIDIGNNWGQNRPRPTPHDLANRGQGNLYNRPEVSDRMANRGAQPGQLRGDRAAGGNNNVFADRDGNVHRRNNNGGWQSHSGRGWQPSIGADRSRGPSNMGRDYGARQRGATRSMPRGGGGRRR